MVTGMVNSGVILGAMVGPLLGGAITEQLGFPWTMTVMAGFSLTMVSGEHFGPLRYVFHWRILHF